MPCLKRYAAFVASGALIASGIVGCSGGGDSTTDSQAAESPAVAVSQAPHYGAEREDQIDPAREQSGPPGEQQIYEEVEEANGRPTHPINLNPPGKMPQTFARGSKASERYSRIIGEAEKAQKPSQKQGKIIALTEASLSKVSASAQLKPGPGSPRWNLIVNYRVEYKAGLHPVGVNVTTSRPGSSVRGGDTQPIGQDRVNSGTMKIPLAFADLPLHVKVSPYSRFVTPLGSTEITVSKHP